MRKLLLLGALSMAVALVLSAPVMAQSTSVSASASASASCTPNGEGGEVCTGLSVDEASELAAEGYSCDQTDDGAYCEGVPSASASADPCPDPDFPRETPDGCQASDLPDVIGGGTPIATADATAEAEDDSSATADATATAESSASALPETGGPGPAVFALPSLVLLVTGGIFALRLVRR